MIKKPGNWPMLDSMVWRILLELHNCRKEACHVLGTLRRHWRNEWGRTPTHHWSQYFILVKSDSICAFYRLLH